METENIIVISDLHIATSRGNGLFQSDEDLAGFLKWITYKEARPCSLVLNGDVFDFLVARKPNTFIDANTFASQAGLMIKNHAEIFDALSHLIDSPEHRLFIIAGNHDPELIFPEVQSAIASEMNQSYRHLPIRWLVNGEALSLHAGRVKILIEHGDQYDDWNYIDHETLRRLVSLNTRGLDGRDVYKPPPGSYMVINRFNLIRDRFPWIERLHPLNFKVLTLILDLIIPKLERGEQFALWGAVNELERMGKRAVINETLRRISPETEFWGESDYGSQQFIEWRAEVQDADTWGKAEPDFAGITERLRKVSAGDGFFDIEKPNRSVNTVNRLINFGNDLVIHGHTHSAKAYRVGKGLYLNSGTWAQLMRLPTSDASEEEWIGFLKRLDKGDADSFSRPTFARVTVRDKAVRAELCEWTEGAPVIKSAWVSEQDGSAWQQEGRD